MYAEIRKYRSIRKEEIFAKVKAEFAPMLRSHAGYVAYYVLDEGGDALASISIFETRDEARDSNVLAADWVKNNIASLVEGPPEITEGEVTVS